MKEWNDIPLHFRNSSVKPYYDSLTRKKYSLISKRIFDIVFSAILLVVLFPIFLVICILIRLDSEGPIFFRQVRITQYGRKFMIFKFRTMFRNAENIGSQITQFNDSRVTRIGAKLRGYRLDEIPQLINILLGDMTFVGTRPEVEKYVNMYNEEMLATLLLPAGVTSEASIQYKDEEKYLKDAVNIDKVYVEIVLPEKMKYNLESTKKINFVNDFAILLKTVLAVIK
ncbi:glycosyl transferase [Paenibacillus sp. Soil766]|nr:sugar transferase [Paenibacillus sp. Soil766]KRE83978.1 glycosyl transferase [Paenibacillus sp. Soil766]